MLTRGNKFFVTNDINFLLKYKPSNHSKKVYVSNELNIRYWLPPDINTSWPLHHIHFSSHAKTAHLLHQFNSPWNVKVCYSRTGRALGSWNTHRAHNRESNQHIFPLCCPLTEKQVSQFRCKAQGQKRPQSWSESGSDSAEQSKGNQSQKVSVTHN